MAIVTIIKNSIAFVVGILVVAMTIVYISPLIFATADILHHIEDMIYSLNP